MTDTTDQSNTHGRRTAMYFVIYKDQAIGISRLAVLDDGMGMALGKFDPLPPYDALRPIFLEFTSLQPERGNQVDSQLLANYFAKRDALGLILSDEHGRLIENDHIHILDWGPEYDADLELEVHITDMQFWAQDQSMK
jgi:hypothetical protein